MNDASKSSADPVEQIISAYVDEYIQNNSAARVVAQGMKVIGVGFRPIIDHITFRTHNVDVRAEEFLKLGYTEDKTLGVIEYENWWAKVYRKKGYPTIFIDQAFDGEREKNCLIPAWVDAFGDKVIHHIAILVDDIQDAIFYLEKQGVPFADKIVGKRGTNLRQIFSKAEVRDGKNYSVLELTERHGGYEGFLPPQADGLMESTRIKK